MWIIGKSKRSFKTRYSEYRGNIKSDNLDEASGLHFNKPGHSLSGMTGSINEFHKFANSFHDTIKFDQPSYNMDRNSCYFLDLEITIIGDKIQTDVYKRPTYRPTTLIPSSAHPKHIPTNIIYSLLFRLMRICSMEDLFMKCYEELCKDTLILIGYDRKLISSQLTKLKIRYQARHILKKKHVLLKVIKKMQIHESSLQLIAILICLTLTSYSENIIMPWYKK